MGADADEHDPLVVARLDARIVRLRLDELSQRHVGRLLDLLRRAMAHENGLALPEHGDALAGHDRVEVDVDRRQREDVLGRVHVVDQGPGDGGHANTGGGTGNQFQHIAFGDIGWMAMVGDTCGRRLSHHSPR